MFSSDPSISWDVLIQRMQQQNQADSRLSVEGRVEFAKRIHYPGGPRDCLLQDYALQEGSTLGMTFASPWFQMQMQRLLADAEGRDQAEFCRSHGFGLHFIEFCKMCQGNLMLGQMQQQMMQQQQQMLALMQEGAQRDAVRDKEVAQRDALRDRQHEEVKAMFQAGAALLSPQKRRASQATRVISPQQHAHPEACQIISAETFH